MGDPDAGVDMWDAGRDEGECCDVEGGAAGDDEVRRGAAEAGGASTRRASVSRWSAGAGSAAARIIPGVNDFSSDDGGGQVRAGHKGGDA
eukprot:2107337-Pyramimonas_sp.AAC.1